MDIERGVPRRELGKAIDRVMSAVAPSIAHQDLPTALSALANVAGLLAGAKAFLKDDPEEATRELADVVETFGEAIGKLGRAHLLELQKRQAEERRR